MKNIILSLILLFCVTANAQNPKVEYKKVGNDLVKATYYFADNNTVIEREGFFNKNEKLQGMWVSYDLQGNKTSIAYYNDGKKDGIWTYFKNDKISIVTYNNNKIINVEEKPIAIN